MSAQTPPLAGRRELLGAVHLHTRYSDGGGSVAELVEAARAAGLDFVVVADHDTLGARAAGLEGWHGGVLVAVATEISTSEECHLLALGNASAAGRYELSVEESLERVHREGGSVLAAHPHGCGLHGRRKALRGWRYWPHPLLGGLEVWSYLQDWADSFRFWQAASYRVEDVRGRIQGPPGWLLAQWDAEAERRPFAGLAASDNHAKRLWPFRRRYWPHEELIGRLVNRVCLAEPPSADGAAAARALLAALAAGRLCFAREELAPSAGFDFRAELADGRVLRPGEGPGQAAGTRLVVESPVEAELSICRLGRPAAALVGRRLERPAESAGAYRAEARLGGKAWAFSNHVRLK